MSNDKPHDKCKTCGRARCCGAKIRVPGRYGDRRHHAAPMANGKCRLHGGLTPVGPLHANYKHGLYSKYLPSRFAELFQALEGRDHLDLTEDIKLLWTRIIDVAQRVDSGESGAKWRELQTQWLAVQKAKNADELEGMDGALTELGDLITSGVADWQAWEKIEDLILKRTKVVESQRKRAVEAHEMLAAQEARAMMRAITEGLKRAVEENVTDADLKRRIFTAASNEFARLVNPGRVQLVSSANN